MNWVHEKNARIASRVALVLAACCATGCTFSPGRPWGELASARVDAAFAPPPERFDDGGRLLTSKSYAIVIDVVVASFTALSLDEAAEGGDIGFDPAAPPEGFSLCHNGHCHSDDGRLVSFADVAAEAGAAAGAKSLILDVGSQVGLREAPAELALECEAPCLLERGDVVAGRLGVSEVSVRGIAFDVLGGRLPVGGFPFELTIAPPADVRGEVSARIERFEPIDWAFDASFVLTASLLDAFDFEDGIEEQALVDAALEVSSSSSLSLALTPTNGASP